jgi:PPIC-type PPIASE domain
LATAVNLAKKMMLPIEPAREIPGVAMSSLFAEAVVGRIFLKYKPKSPIAKSRAVAGCPMRVVLICSAMLACATPMIAQGTQLGADLQNPATPLSRRQMLMRRAQPLGKPTNTEVPPDTQVITLEGVCDHSRVPATKDCKTVITRAQMDSIIDLLAPGTPQGARPQFAINYVRLLAASGVAQREHLEKDPVVANELEAQLKLVRMQVLANTLYHQMQEQADNVPISEIQKYYTDHQANFDQGKVWRLYVPNSIAGTNGQPLDASAIKAKAEELRERAAAGEDFDQLQREVYKNLGINVAPPLTKLNMVRRTSLPQDEAKVFDLNVGELSPVLESGSALVILKLESKQSMPVESAGPEIKSILQRDRRQHELQSAANNVKAQFNLKYLDMPSAPELFPPSALAQPGAKSDTASNLRSRMRPRRRMPPGANGMPVLPPPHP